MNLEYTAILVDDELDALSIIELKLKKFFPQIKIIGMYNDPTEAIEAINSLNPSIVFCDINMPSYTGFELLAEIDNPAFEIIFVTAYDQFAIEAIKHAVVGYVLKPISDSDFNHAVLLALKSIQAKSAVNSKSSEPLTRISIPFNNGFAVKQIKDIIRFEGFNGYTKIYLENDVITSSYNIGLFNKMLQGTTFRAVHKSHLINLDFIDKYLNEGIIVLTNGDKVPVSKTNKQDIIKVLKFTN